MEKTVKIVENEVKTMMQECLENPTAEKKEELKKLGIYYLAKCTYKFLERRDQDNIAFYNKKDAEARKIELEEEGQVDVKVIEFFDGPAFASF